MDRLTAGLAQCVGSDNMKERNLNMTTGHPGKLLLTFSLPLMFGNVFQQMYTVVDTAIVGNGVGMTALAALGTVDWMNWMYLGIVQGFTQGFSVLLSQKYGQCDEKGLKAALGTSIRLAVIFGLITAAVAQLVLGVFMDFLQVPQVLYGQAELYSRIILLGIPAMMYYNLTASILRSVGDSKTPLLAMVVAAISNIAFDCIAVFVFDWGIAGAAGATVIAQVLAGTLCTLRIVKTPQLRIDRTCMKRNPMLSKQLMGLGWPVAMQNVVISIGGMALQSVVNGFDTSFIAGFTATNKLYGLLEIAAISYGYAVTTYTGQNYGAMHYARIRKGINWAVIISVATSVLIGMVMVIFGRPITMLFISADDPQLAVTAGETAYRYLCVMAFCLPVLYLLHAYRSALQGMGNTRMPLLSGIVELVMRLGSALIISIIHYQSGIFFAEVLAWLGAAALLAFAYYRSAKRLDSSQMRDQVE